VSKVRFSMDFFFYY